MVPYAAGEKRTKRRSRSSWKRTLRKRRFCWHRARTCSSTSGAIRHILQPDGANQPQRSGQERKKGAQMTPQSTSRRSATPTRPKIIGPTGGSAVAPVPRWSSAEKWRCDGRTDTKFVICYLFLGKPEFSHIRNNNLGSRVSACIVGVDHVMLDPWITQLSGPFLLNFQIGHLRFSIFWGKMAQLNFFSSAVCSTYQFILHEC